MTSAALAALLLTAALPDRALTPGAIALPNVADVCVKVPRSRRAVLPTQRRAVFDRYHVPPCDRGRYVLDHLVPLGLGGANTASNLWPQREAEGHAKDRVEIELRHRVCAGTIALDVAVIEIETDWRAAYLAYVKPRRHTRR